jgi:hypothetical protein
VLDFGKDDAVISCVRSGLCRLYLLVGRSFVSIMFITLWRRLFCVKRFLGVSTKNMDPSFQRDSGCPLCDELVHLRLLDNENPSPALIAKFISTLDENLHSTLIPTSSPPSVKLSFSLATSLIIANLVVATWSQPHSPFLAEITCHTIRIYDNEGSC